MEVRNSVSLLEDSKIIIMFLRKKLHAFCYFGFIHNVCSSVKLGNECHYSKIER